MNRRQIQQQEWTRRQWIFSGASLAVLPWLAQCGTAVGVLRNPRFAENPFTLGVASGDPTSDGVVLWTRLAPEPLQGGGLFADTIEVRWELAADEGFRKIVRSGVETATSALGHSVHAEVSGLQPDTWYWFRFLCGDAVSRSGRTRTMPAADSLPARLKMCFASCQHYETGLFTAYEHMAQEHPDLVLHLGDYIYEYEGKDHRVRKHAGPEITTLEHYRNRYAQYRLDPQLQTMHALCPWLVVWDDHEFDNNCAGAVSEEAEVDPQQFLLRRANAYQAYYENMPLRKPAVPSGPDMRLYRTIDFGRLARIEMLDTRQYRSDQPNGDGLKPLSGAALDPRTTMLGDVQEQWLLQELSSSHARWNILGQQVMMARVDRVPGADQKFSMDQWSGYEAARNRLLSEIASRKISNPIVLTGDIHSNWVNDLLLDFGRPQDAAVATEFVCTSISSGGNGTQKATGHALLMSENPFVKFQNSERGYVSCEVTPDEWRSRYQVVEYVDRPGAPLITRSAWAVENGRAGARQI